MTEDYKNKLICGIGRVRISSNVSNPFPLVGDKVLLASSMRWAKDISYKTQVALDDSAEELRENVNQEDVKELTIKSRGDLRQEITAANPISSAREIKYVYAMEPRPEPYYDIGVTKEIIRNDGEITKVIISPENGYDLSRPSGISVRIYPENDYTTPVMELTRDDFFATATGMESSGISLDRRGLYDVLVDITDTESGVTISKQVNKLITVTPRLASRPTREQIDSGDYTTQNVIEYFDGGVKKRFIDRIYKTGEESYYIEWIMPKGQDGTGYYPHIDISGYPAGSTLVLKYDPDMGGERYHMRLLLKGNSPSSVSASNGTPNLTYDKPLVITFDQDEPFIIWGVHYSAVNYDANIRNTVFDGRGYHDLSKGLVIDRFSDDLYFEDCMMLLNGTSDVEIFEMEMRNPGFTSIASKTDPDPDRPWYWYGNFSEDNFILHHCHVHDTSGEGFYVGYFTPEKMSKVNSAGVRVEYRPHSMERCRIYRNLFERLGYDGMQLSNARNSEVCYNVIRHGAYKNEMNQATGISIQSMGGRIYNNIVSDFYGPGLQAGPLGNRLEIFNNIIYDAHDGGGAIQFLWSNDTPDQDPDGTGVNNTTDILVHNNVLIAKSICINARNTTQMMRMFIYDNLMTYRKGIIGGQAEATLNAWREQMAGNVIYKYDDISPEVLAYLKIADFHNGDFRISHDSPMVEGGNGKYFSFDFNGYRSYFPSVFPSGPFQGKYKNPDMDVPALKLNAIVINDGDASTYLPVVGLRFDYTGTASRYRVGMSEDLSGAVWMDLHDNVTLALDAAYGVKTVYAQLGGTIEVSAVASDSIEYIYVPTLLTGVLINGGDTSTLFNRVRVTISHDLGRPEQYMISETEMFANATWLPFEDTVDYVIEGDSRTVTLYVKIKKEGVESEVGSASIEFVSTIEYKDMTLRVPLSELPEGLGNAKAEIPGLKYGKRFALSWTMDDTLVYVYSRLFKYINKKWVDDSKIFHDGMGPTTGIMPDRYLCYTDGCGRDVRFSLNSAFVSHLNNKTPVLDYSFSGSQYFHLGEMERFIDYGNGIQNHGAGGYNDQGAAEAIRICNEEVLSKLGLTPFLLLFPGEEDATLFAEAGEADPDVYQMSSGKKDSELGLSRLSDTFFRNKRTFMNRLTYDGFDLDGLKAKADYAHGQDNAFLLNFGGHNIEMDNSKFLDWSTEMMPFLDYLYDTYGKGGDDSIWFASLEEIYEYIFVRHFSSIAVSDDGTDLIINIKIAGMRNFRRKDLSLKLSGIDFSGVKTINADVDTYYIGKGIHADGSLLVNIDRDGNLVALAEKYVTVFEKAPSQDSLEDAEYMVSRLSADLRTPYRVRINAMNKPFGLRSVSINGGSTETSKREVGVTIVYDGFTAPSAYRLGESPDLEGIGWIAYAPGIRYALSDGLGTKTVYCQVKAPDGTLSKIISTSIELVEAGARTAVVSLGWSNSEIPNTTPGYSMFDNGTTKFQSQAPVTNLRTIYDQEGEVFGTAVPSSVSVMMITNIPGSVTGDDSGIYLDGYLRHNSSCGGNVAKSESVAFTLPAGAYKVSVLANTSWAQRQIPNDALSYRVVTDTDGMPIALPESGVQENTSHMTVPVEVTVGETGSLRVEFGLSGLTSVFYYAPLNIIKIEEVR